MVTRQQLTQVLKEFFGFDKFKGRQEDIIMSLLEGRDTFVLMPTGGGKSLCYQLPALVCPGTAVVISPLIALMKNQVDAMRQYSGDDIMPHSSSHRSIAPIFIMRYVPRHATSMPTSSATSSLIPGRAELSIA